MTVRTAVPHPVKTAGRVVSVRVGSATAGRRQLPSFILVGAQRAGTTSLFRALMSHPLIHAANYHKGVNYFDVNYGRDFSWYQGHFPTGSSLRRRARGYRRRAGDVRGQRLLHVPPLRARADRPAPPGRPHRRDAPRSRRARLLRLEARAGPGLRDRAVRERTRARGRAAGRPGGADARRRRLPELTATGTTPTCAAASTPSSCSACTSTSRPSTSTWSRASRSSPGPRPLYARLLDQLGLPLVLPDRFDRWNGRPSSPMATATRRRLLEHFESHDRSLAELLGREPAWLA